MHAAQAIYQTNLDIRARALMELDLGTAMAHVALPLHMITGDSELVLSSADDVFITMSEYLDFLRMMGVTKCRHICRDAQFADRERSMITGAHDTYLMKGDEVIYAAGGNQLTIMRIGSDWRCIRNEIRCPNAENPVICADMAAAQAREWAERYREHACSRLNEARDPS